MWQLINERKNASPLLGFIPLFSSMSKDIPQILNTTLNIESLVEFKRGHVRMAVVPKEWEIAGTLTVQKLESPSFVEWVVDGLDRETLNLNKIGNSLISIQPQTFSNQYLSKYFCKVIEALERFVVYNNVVNVSDFYHDTLTRRIKSFLDRARETVDDISSAEAYCVLTTPMKTVWIQEQEEDFLKILFFVQSNPSLLTLIREKSNTIPVMELYNDLLSKLDLHSMKYFWIEYEQEGETLAKKDFISRLSHAISEDIDAKRELDKIYERRQQAHVEFERVINHLNISDIEACILSAARQFVYWKLHLREVKVRFYCCADVLMQEIAVRLNLNINQVRHMTSNELVDALNRGESVDAELLNRRIDRCVIHFTANGFIVLDGQEAQDAFSVVADEAIAYSSATEIIGTCACLGSATGIVKQVLSVEDIATFQRGNILVAYMTDVGIVPAMKRAAAIVTDVGGVTCHAAIIAREFGIPCIIGTRIATKILLDGHMVKVDATQGIVKILSKRNFTAEFECTDTDDSDDIFATTLQITLANLPNPPSYTMNLASLTSQDVCIAGGKGAALGEIIQAGLPVPQGFVVLTSAFDAFISESKLNVEINSLLKEIRDQNSLLLISERIQALIKNSYMQNFLSEAIQRDFDKLDSYYVAVRSSAPTEDSVTASWAGQLESYLNTTRSELIRDIQRCWASIFSVRALSYRLQYGGLHNPIAMAVVVQEMIASDCSGTAFSVHPITGDHCQMVIEACFGLGETLVLGKETPNKYIVSKDSISILEKTVNRQIQGMRRASGGGNEWYEIAENDANTQVLSDEDIVRLSSVVIRIEKHYGFPVDVEWAFDKSTLYIIQSRPITTLAKKL